MLPRNIRVASLQSSESRLKIVTFWDPISVTYTSSAVPISSSVGAPSLANATALRHLQSLLSSNLD